MVLSIGMQREALELSLTVDIRLHRRDILVFGDRFVTLSPPPGVVVKPVPARRRDGP
jgi:hypothetical protein